ncbi:Response regulator aspartate phosphatase [Bacillus cereus]|nr:Response regulator aspartate phosphatase [Bacillus cereus]
MTVQEKSNKQLMELLHEWYEEIRLYHVVEAKQTYLKVKESLKGIETDQYVSFYYSLLNFRYKVLVDGMSITKDSFNQIEKLPHIKDEFSFLAYYYYFFKAIHSTIIANYTEAKTYYEKAEGLLKDIPDEIEKAEFEYRFSTYCYQSYQPFEAIQHAIKAKEIYLNHVGYKINIALCDNVYGLACIDLREFERAEECLNMVIDIFKKYDEEQLLLRVRSNLGWLYNIQDLYPLAIRQSSEIINTIPNHFKALFVLARAYYKLEGIETARAYYKLEGIETARAYIEQGMKYTNESGNEEYKHRFAVLNELITELPRIKLEKVVTDAISYFEKEEMWDCVKEYAEILALQFYETNNHVKASKYFYISNNADKKHLRKGALK